MTVCRYHQPLLQHGLVASGLPAGLHTERGGSEHADPAAADGPEPGTRTAAAPVKVNPRNGIILIFIKP